MVVRDGNSSNDFIAKRFKLGYEQIVLVEFQTRQRKIIVLIGLNHKRKKF